MAKFPTLYIPHGGGPCFFMDWTMGPANTWERMAAWLRALGGEAPGRPRALLVVSAHWEEAVPTVLTGSQPELLFDYYGFPPHTYELKWPAPGSPQLAGRVRALLKGAGIESGENAERGFDHGVFVPLLLTYPQADIPTIQLSLRSGLDAAEHLAIGRALAPLRDEEVLIIGSGMSYHNMRGFGSRAAGPHARRFDDWLTATVELPDAGARAGQLIRWQEAPDALLCHPRSEHLTPLFVAAGAAATEPGRRIFTDNVMGVDVSAVRFG